MGGASRDGGKAKPLKKPKSQKSELSEEDIAFQERKRAAEADRKKLAEQAKGKGPLNTGNQGIKKSGKK
ncbi:MAG: hypothetical protein M1840_001869 [Geoglossum simile]|nr:MAG: hypothetical protein M1840_001869 [Geoglossum simile]